MNEKSKTYIIDIDDTICAKTNGDYENAKPFKDRIKKINKLFDAGNTIIYWTARGMGRNKGNMVEAYKEFYDLTKDQLKRWGCKYTDLKLGKPIYDVWVDDKCVNDKDFFK